MIEILKDIKLHEFTSWQIGGLAENFCFPTSIDELIEAQRWTREQGMPVTVLGGGSNVLISDEGIKGLTICLRKLTGLKVSHTEDSVKIEAFAGTNKSELLRAFIKLQLSPALFLAGLPGDVGGGVVMNAGVGEDLKPREFFEIVEWVEVLKPDDQVRRYSKDEIQWSYRHSKGWQPGIITKVGFAWPMDIVPSILDQVKALNRTRLNKQPLLQPSCGSVFVNPPGLKAAQLIDSCGLKGYTIGEMQVSPKHANFIVNLGAGKARDCWALIEHVQKVVKQKTQVDLVTEVVRLGVWD